MTGNTSLLISSSRFPSLPSSSPIYSAPFHVGILEEACYCNPIDYSRPRPSSRTSREDPGLSPNLQTLLTILCIFEPSDTVFHFTQNRKMLLQILGSLLEASDCLELLLTATRMIGKWMLETIPGPFTKKERNSFLSKLAQFDYCSLSDDTTAQPLADLVASFAGQLLAICPEANIEDHVDGLLPRRLAVTCLLNANAPSRDNIISQYFGKKNVPLSELPAFSVLWKVLKSDFEGLGGRYWTVLIVDTLINIMQVHSASTEHGLCLASLQVLVHGDVVACQRLLEYLLPLFWKKVPEDSMRLSLVSAIESLLSQPFHSQFLRDGVSDSWGPQSMNSIRSLVNAVTSFAPVPIFDSHLLVHIAENYNCWYEVLLILEHQYLAFSEKSPDDATLSVMRHCYRLLGERNVWLSLGSLSCKLPLSKKAISFDMYGMTVEASASYSELVQLMEDDSQLSVDPTQYEMDLWESRWIELQRELCQQEVVGEFANASGAPHLLLECAWKSQDWKKLRTLCSSPALLPAIECGDPVVKITETLLAVAEGKLTEVENLHAQTAQLCLYRWQLLPVLTGGSPSHASLLHYFHRKKKKTIVACQSFPCPTFSYPKPSHLGPPQLSIHSMMMVQDWLKSVSFIHFVLVF